MKKNDIIDKLNIIDRKIDELTYLNVSAIVDEDADKKNKKDDGTYLLAMLALILGSGCLINTEKEDDNGLRNDE